MTPGSIICDVCSTEIISAQEILRHVKLHQSQMLSLINRLDFGQHIKVCNVAFNESSDGDDSDDSNVPDSFGNTDHVENDANRTFWALHNQPPTSVQASIQVRQTQGMNFKCPRQQCKRKRFRRKQEFVRHLATHHKIRQVCPSCSTTFTEASKFKTHRCGASVEERRIIRAQYDEIRRDIEMQFGLRNPSQSNSQIEQSNVPGQRNGESLDSQVLSAANAIDGGTALPQLQSHAAAVTGQQSPSILPQLGVSGQFITHEYSHTDYNQLYSLFDNVPSSTQQREPQEMQQLWDAFDSNVFLPQNQGPDMLEKQV